MELSLRGLGDVTCPPGFTVSGAQCANAQNPTQLLSPADAAKAGSFCFPGGWWNISGNYQNTVLYCGGIPFTPGGDHQADVDRAHLYGKLAFGGAALALFALPGWSKLLALPLAWWALQESMQGVGF
jgi:hypothetical protein